MGAFEDLSVLLPEPYSSQLRRENFVGLEEIRVRVGYPVQLVSSDGISELMPTVKEAVPEEILHRACQRSVYAYTETISKGYITVSGGHRIGICGVGVLDGPEIRTIKELSSVNIRVARAYPGCADSIIHYICGSALLIGPPGSGKTTLLRDLVRQLSDLRRQKIALIDERGEIASVCGGQAQYHVGKYTDIMTNIPKKTAIIMLLKTMSPQWIAVDEITSAEDLIVMEQASFCGVHLLATAHAACREDLYRRPLYRTMMEREIFRQLIVVRPDKTCWMEDLN